MKTSWIGVGQALVWALSMTVPLAQGHEESSSFDRRRLVKFIMDFTDHHDTRFTPEHVGSEIEHVPLKASDFVASYGSYHCWYADRESAFSCPAFPGPKNTQPDQDNLWVHISFHEPALFYDYIASSTATIQYYLEGNEVIPDDCCLPSDPGPCEGVYPKYYFDTGTSTCQSFDYGGCAGNGNRFDSSLDCEAVCSPESCQSTLVDTVIVTLPPHAELTGMKFGTADVGRRRLQTCDGIKEYSDCGTACPRTCENYLDPIICTLNCVEGCFCPDGTVLDEVTDTCVTEDQCDACCLPVDVGPCDAVIPSFYFDQSTGACESFTYGGCGGNDNRFASESDCAAACPAGSCGTVPTCPGIKEYNACGTACPKTCDNYDADIICIAVCVEGCFCPDGTVLDESTGDCVTVEQCDACCLPVDVGPCDAAFPSFYFDQSTGTCESFTYGGCEGNDNRFASESDCAAACPAGSCGTVPPCCLPVDVGPCDAAFPSFYFDQSTGTCESFTYGGCEGSDNRFASESDCAAACPAGSCGTVPTCPGIKEYNACGTACPKTCDNYDADIICIAVCVEGCFCPDGTVLDESTGDCVTVEQCDACCLPVDVGPCDAAFPSFYFDQSTGTCESFTYGGCEGNDNRFASESDCAAACPAGSCGTVPPCCLPVDVGPCDAAFPSFYFDQSTGTCESFTYGGCEGNDNRFASESDCAAACPAGSCDCPTCNDSVFGGDPHFLRWKQEKRDTFHGECDLIMLHSHDFHGGSGLDIVSRTTIESHFSYIETAAVRIGNHVLQVLPDKVYLDGQLHPIHVGDETSLQFPIITFESDDGVYKYSYGVDHKKTRKNKRTFRLWLDKKTSIEFRFFKKYLTVSINGHPDDLVDGYGLLGRFTDGKMQSRDGADFLGTFLDYGFEWQVDPLRGDPQLFVEDPDRAPQLPYERCRLPAVSMPSRRRLRANDGALYEQARSACSAVTGNNADLELCILDVVSTGEIGLAEVW